MLKYVYHWYRNIHSSKCGCAMLTLIYSIFQILFVNKKLDFWKLFNQQRADQCNL